MWPHVLQESFIIARLELVKTVQVHAWHAQVQRLLVLNVVSGLFYTCLIIHVKVIVHLDTLRIQQRINVQNVQTIVKRVNILQPHVFLAIQQAYFPICINKLVRVLVLVVSLCLTLIIPVLIAMLPARLALFCLRTALHVSLI